MACWRGDLGVGDVLQLGEADVDRAGASASRGQALAVQDRVFRHPGGDIAQGAEVIDYGDSLVIDYDPAQEARVVSSR